MCFVDFDRVLTWALPLKQIREGSKRCLWMIIYFVDSRDGTYLRRGKVTLRDEKSRKGLWKAYFITFLKNAWQRISSVVVLNISINVRENQGNGEPHVRRSFVVEFNHHNTYPAQRQTVSSIGGSIFQEPIYSVTKGNNIFLRVHYIVNWTAFYGDHL